MLGLIENWLLDSSNPQQVEIAVRIMAGVHRELPERVAELIEKHFLLDKELWLNHFLYLAQGFRLESNRRFFELFLKIIENGVFRFNSESFRSFTYDLGIKEPTWACEALGVYLNKWLELYLVESQNSSELDAYKTPPTRSKEMIPHFDQEVLSRCSINAPIHFIELIVPFAIRVSEITKDITSEIPYRDLFSYYRTRDGFGVSQAELLHALEKALMILAKDRPEKLEAIFQKYTLLESEYETSLYLVVRAYTANGEKFAEQAIDLLTKNSACLKLGYVEDVYIATTELLEAITPYCFGNKLAQLENTILGFNPKWEMEPKHNYHGWGQYKLLESIGVSGLSEKGKKRLLELKRKFGELDKKKPASSKVGFIQSPILEGALNKMTDDQWLKAILNYDGKKVWSLDGDIFKGNAHQLSIMLESFTKKEPVRFAKLALRFSEKAHSYYFEAILRGLLGYKEDLSLIIEVCRYCNQLPNRPLGQGISHLIESLADQQFPEDIFTMVGWYATEDPNPENDIWRVQASGGSPYYGGNILDAGLNSVRGAAAGAITALIFKDQNRAKFFLPYLRKMVKDPRISIRAWGAEVLTAVLNYNRD